MRLRRAGQRTKRAQDRPKHGRVKQWSLGGASPPLFFGFVVVLITTMALAGSSSAQTRWEPARQVDQTQLLSTDAIYDDVLDSNFADWSWADHDFTSTPAAVGSAAIGANYQPWQGVFFVANQAVGLDDTSVRFMIRGDGQAPAELEFRAFDSDWATIAAKRISPTGTWTSYEVDLSTSLKPLLAIWWQETGGTSGRVLIDQIELVSGATQPQPTATPIPPTPVPPTPVPPTPVPPTPVPPTPVPPTPVPPTPVPPTPTPAPGGPAGYAVYETFDGDPSAPSQALLPDNFDFVVTNRMHPGEALGPFPSFPADHAPNCAGPNPAVSPLPQHDVVVSHHSNGANPDPSFFVCKNHMMSALGDVSGYSVSAFWPRQEFEFSAGGQIEFEVNLDERNGRHWWEVMIIPAHQLKVGAADEAWPIDEVYADQRIVFEFRDNKRRVHLGNGPGQAGRTFSYEEPSSFADRHPGDPANTDRRIRRKNILALSADGSQIEWSIETADGSFDTQTIALTAPLPLTRGLAVITTHAYTPTKVDNFDQYTFHWDNLGFTGPVVGQYDAYEAPNAITLENNGNRPIGDRASQTIQIPRLSNDLRLTGQVHYPLIGQVQLSINGASPIVVNPLRYTSNACSAEGWNSFVLDLEPSMLEIGTNTFEWIVGPRPGCSNGYPWDGFSIKALEVQVR